MTKWKVGETVRRSAAWSIPDRTCRGLPTAGEEQLCETGGATLTYNGYERDGKTPHLRRLLDTQSPWTRPTCCSIPRGTFRSSARRRCYAPASPPIRRSGTSERQAGRSRSRVVGLGGLGHMAREARPTQSALESPYSAIRPSKREGCARASAPTISSPPARRTCSKRMPSRFDFILDTVSAKHDLQRLPQPADARRHDGAGRRCPSLRRLPPPPLIMQRRQPGRIADRRHPRDAGDARFLRASTGVASRRRGDSDRARSTRPTSAW